MTKQNMNPPLLSNHFAELGTEFYSHVQPQPLAKPILLHYNQSLANNLGLETCCANETTLLSWASGQQLIGPTPLAMNYSGHQFGGFNPDLGDGRGLLLGEWRDKNSKLWDFHLKGAGKTPYSRFGDGRAVLRSSIREYLVGEALYALDVPTTRCLSLVASPEEVMRESYETTAMIVRVSESHIRFGSFEQFFYTQQYPQLRQLADYCIERYADKLDPALEPHTALLQMATTRTAEMIAHWQAVGFNHGVMNTDNMSIIGDTFDFGPYAFLDDYEPNFICNHTDAQGRYAFAQQINMGLWNLNALAHALSPLIDMDSIKGCLMSYQTTLEQHYQQLMNAKLGLLTQQEEDRQLLSDWLEMLHRNKADYSLSFRYLAQQLDPSSHSSDLALELRQLHGDPKIPQWLERYRLRVQQEHSDFTVCAAKMNATNPLYILRTHLLQGAIDKAQAGDSSEVDRLYDLAQSPFKERCDFEEYAQAPQEDNKGMPLSCSS